MHFLSSIEYCKEKVDELKNIPCVWKQKILVVDDDKAISSLLSAILKKEWEVDLAFNGKEALSKLRNSFYDLIISDIDMPVMDGFELYSQASSLIKEINSIFIFHTGELTHERKEYFEGKKISYMQKPSSIETIKDLVRQKLQKYALEEKL